MNYLVRLLALGVGTFVVASLIIVPGNGTPWLLVYFVVIATVGVMLTAYVFRMCQVRITELGSDEFIAETRLQFTIQHLMLLTLIVAGVFAIGRLLVPDSRRLSYMELPITGFGFLFATITSTWVMLGTSKPELRIFVMFLVPYLASVPAFFYFENSIMGKDILTTGAIAPVILLCTLFVLRQCKYRLVHVKSK